LKSAAAALQTRGCSKEFNMDRRTFVSTMMASAAFSGVIGEIVSPRELMAAVEAVNQLPEGKDQVFWSGFFDDVDPAKPHATTTRGPGGEPTVQPVPDHVQPEKLPRFLHYHDQKGLRFAENIDRDELPKIEAGAATVSMTVSGFRPSAADSHKISDASSAQLQLHASQTQPIAKFIAPLTWASLASVFGNSKNSKNLPTVDQLNPTTGDGSTGTSGSNRILLPGSEGKLALNLTLPDRHAWIHKLVDYALQGAQGAAPLFAMPAISVPAIKAFTSFYNTLVQNSGFIINSPLKDVAASYYAVDSGNLHADALKLMTGQYVIVPAYCVPALSSAMDSLKMVSGYLIPKDTPDHIDPEQVAKTAIPDVTYATLKVSVDPAADVLTGVLKSGA
jgi:hypothetical protein